MNDPLVRWAYCLLRWVPNPARGEFVNIGAVVFDDEDEDGLMLRLSKFSRANRLGQMPEHFTEMIENVMRPLREAAPPKRFEAAKQMNHDHRNLIQFTSPMPMAVSSIEEAMRMIFETAVGEE